MPIDPRSYFIQTPQMQGPLDAFKDYVSLRDMMDRRRYQDMQERRLQMQLDEAQREQQENERYRQGLMTLPASPTLQQAVQHLGPKGINYWKAQQEAVKEGRLAESAELERDAKRGNIQKDVNERIAGLGMQAYRIEDPRQREEFFNAGVAGALIDAGITPAEQFGAYRVPANRKEAEFSFGSLTNPDKLQAYLKAENEAKAKALEFSGNQIDHFGHLLGSVRDQNTWTAALKAAPPEIAALLPPMFSPAALQQARAMTMTGQQQAQEARQALPNNPDELILWMNQPGRTPDELQQGKAALAQMTKYHQDIRPTVMQDTGGLISAVLQNPGLWDQLSAEAKAKIAPDLARAGFTGFGKPLSDTAKEQITGLRQLESSLSDYKAELDRVGPTYFDVEKGAQLNSLYKILMMQLKEAFRLGVLNGPDLAIMESTISDPGSLKGNYLGTAALDKQLDVLRNFIGGKKTVFAETWGKEYEKIFPAAAKPPGDKPKPSDIPNPLLNTDKPARKPLSSFYR